MKRELNTVSVPVIILASFICFASSAEDASNIKESAREIGKETLGKVQESTKRDIVDTEVGKAINFQGTNLPETQYSHGNMYDAAKQKAADKDNLEAQITEKAFLRQKEYPITHKDSFLDKAKFASKNPEVYVDWLRGKYADCKQEGGEEILAKDIKVCDEYKQLTEKSCIIGRKIQVEAKHKYECIKERKHYTMSCKSTLSLTCKEMGATDAIFTAIAKADLLDKTARQNIYMDLKPSGAYLDITQGWGVHIHGGRWGCAGTQHAITLNIENIEEVVSLKISYIELFALHGHLTLLVNGQRAFITPGAKPATGPLSAHDNDIKRTYKDTPNIDIKPFLRNGINNLILEIAACGGGSFRFQLHAMAPVCKNWEEHWGESCE